MHVKEDLHRGHLRMCSEQAEELSALLAQAEFGDYNQNTAKYWYTELCGNDPDQETVNRYTSKSFMNFDCFNCVTLKHDDMPKIIMISLLPEK